MRESHNFELACMKKEEEEFSQYWPFGNLLVEHFHFTSLGVLCYWTVHDPTTFSQLQSLTRCL